jgi:hypothetical protein
MPGMMLPMEKGGPKRLKLTWSFRGWKNFTVRLDGIPMAYASGKKELEAGRDFILPDRSVLSVKLHKTPFGHELKVLRNGEPLPGHGSDPLRRLKLSWYMLFFIGGLNILLGAAAMAMGPGMLQGLGLGLGSSILGAVFLLLGFLVRRRSALALGLAMALLAVDAALTMYWAAESGRPVPVSGMLIRAFFLVCLFRGLSALRELKR